MAQKVLFITTRDLKRYSVLNGNIDPNKLMYHIEIAQDTEVQNYLGTKLLEKVQDLIKNNAIDNPANEDYKELLETYIQPMTIYWALVSYMPFAAYTIANGGVFKHTSENSVTVDKSEVDYLANKYRDIAQFYTNNFIDFMIYNESKYPEYNQNVDDDTYPDQGGANFGGWVL